MSATALTVVDTAQRPRSERIQVTDPIPVMDTGRFEQMQRIASIMASSTLIPESFAGYWKEEGESKTFVPFEFQTIVANCFLVINQAVGWNMDPFSVIQCVSIVRGRVCYEGKLVAAVIERRAGVLLSYTWNEATGDALEITVSGTLPGEQQPRIVKGTVGQWKTTGAKSPWPRDPRKQLAYRGAREWARLHKPGTMLGVYTDDELEEALGRQLRRPPPPPTAISDASQPEASQRPAVEHKPAVEIATVADKREPVAAETKPPAPTQRRPPVPPKIAETPARPIDMSELWEKLRAGTTHDAVTAAFDEWIAPREKHMSEAQLEEAQTLLNEICARFTLDKAE